MVCIGRGPELARQRRWVWWELRPLTRLALRRKAALPPCSCSSAAGWPGQLCAAKEARTIQSSLSELLRLSRNCAASCCAGRRPFRCADGLAYVALGVFGDVDEESDHRGGELFAAYGAGGGQDRGI